MATWQAGRAARGCVGRLRGGDLLFWERPCSVFFPLVFALCSFFFVLFFRTLLQRLLGGAWQSAAASSSQPPNETHYLLN